MKAPVNVFALLCLVSTVQLTLLAASADAQDEPPPPSGDAAPTAPEASTRSKQLGADRWVPSLAVTSGVFYQKWEGDVSSTCSGCTSPVNQPLVRPAASGDDNDVTAFVGGQLELMTPELPIPLSPRFFVGGGVLPAFGVDRKIANEGNVGRIDVPSPIPGDESVFNEASMLGQGSQTEAKIVDDFVYEAHAGLAFPFEILGRQLRVKPSAGWVHYEIEVKGAVSDADCRTVGLFGATDCNPNSATPGLLRAVELNEKDTGTFDGVGGGMDLEMDVFQIGPFSSSLFIGAHAYKILSDREVEFDSTASFTDTGFPGLPAADYSSSHRLEVDPWFYRMGLGFRMNWVGFAAAD
jgi:hypothetical protein